jgi:hypothetical protein
MSFVFHNLTLLKSTRKLFLPGVVAHTCHPSTWEAGCEAQAGYIARPISRKRKKEKKIRTGGRKEALFIWV